MFKLTEQWVGCAVEWLRLVVETLGAFVIALGLLVALVGLLRHFLSRRGSNFTPIRLTFARYLTLALEFQLAADILSTSIAPSWDQIGQLGAIAVIRTALNFFLDKEIEGARSTGEPPEHLPERTTP